MAIGKVVRGGLLLGVAVGVGAAIVAPAVWRVMRPTAKSALRAGLTGYGAARVAAARAGEEVEDLVAEVVHEMETEAETDEAAGDAAESVGAEPVGAEPVSGEPVAGEAEAAERV